MKVRKKRYIVLEEDKSELIEIHQDILEKFLSTPKISHDKHFLLIKIYLIQEELHIYWKVENKTKRKKAWTEVLSPSKEVYSRFKERREEAIYFQTLRKITTQKKIWRFIQGKIKIERFNDRTENFGSNRPAIELHMKVFCFNKSTWVINIWLFKASFKRSLFIILAVKIEIEIAIKY